MICMYIIKGMILPKNKLAKSWINSYFDWRNIFIIKAYYYVLFNTKLKFLFWNILLVLINNNIYKYKFNL